MRASLLAALPGFSSKLPQELMLMTESLVLAVIAGAQLDCREQVLSPLARHLTPQLS